MYGATPNEVLADIRKLSTPGGWISETVVNESILIAAVSSVFVGPCPVLYMIFISVVHAN